MERRSMSKRLAPAALVAGLVLAAAVVHAQDAAKYFPLTKGDKWVYASKSKTHATVNGQDLEIQNTSGTETREITGPSEKVVDPKGVVVQRAVIEEKGKLQGNDGEIKVTITSHLGLQEGTVWLYQQTSEGLPGQTADEQKYHPALVLYKAGVKQGDPWDIGTLRQQKLLMPAKGKIVGMEDVKVPAGEFKGCVKMVVEATEPTGQIEGQGFNFDVKKGRATDTAWYAEGVGLVK